MILAATFLMALAAPGAAPSVVAAPDTAEEITVVGRLLKSVRASVRTRKDKSGAAVSSCKIRQSSGDTDIDAAFCDVMRECLPKAGTDAEAAGTCLTAAFNKRTTEIAEARLAARSERQ